MNPENNWRSLVLEGLIQVWITDANINVLGDRSEIERSIARQVLAMYGAYDMHAECMKSMRALSADERVWIGALISMAESIDYSNRYHIGMALVKMGNQFYFAMQYTSGDPSPNGAKRKVMTTQEKIEHIRSYGFWVRECSEGSPVKFIVVDPMGNEDGLMVAGDEDVLDDTLESLQAQAS